MNSANNSGFPVRAYSLKELSAMYHVNKKTLRKWLKPFEIYIGERTGYYYNNAQVKIIFEKLGDPQKSEEKRKKKEE